MYALPSQMLSQSVKPLLK